MLLLLLLSACGGKNDPPPSGSSATEHEGKVEKTAENIIQDRYREINGWLSLAELSLDSSEYDCPNDPAGGRISFFHKKDELVLVKHDYYLGDHFGASEFFYLINEQPVFIHRIEESWNFAGPANGDPATPHTQDDISEYRFYLGGEQQALKCLRKDYVLRSWIELPTDPDEVPNRAIECGVEVTESLERFGLLINRISPLNDC